MKIIFLDFDGVINCTVSPETIHPALVQNVLTIVERTNSKIVLSTSWRCYWDRITYEPKLRTIEEIMVRVPQIPIELVVGMTPNLGNTHKRQEEIQAWLDKHQPEQYVILDDWAVWKDMPNVVQTDAMYGLTSNDVKKAVEILNG